MDESMYTILFAIIIVLLIVIAIFSVLAYTGQKQAAAAPALGVNKNISKLNTTLSNSINSKLNNFINTSSNIITTALTIGTNNINETLSLNINKIINASNRNNANISELVTNQNAVITQVQAVDTDVKALPNMWGNVLNASLNAYLANLSLRSTSGLQSNTIIFWTINQSVTPSNYIVYGLPDTFANHIELSASGPIQATIMTIFQFANFSAGTSSQSIESIGSSGSSNNINFWYNVSTGCSLYELIITAPSQTNTIVVHPNVSGVLMPSATIQGVCRD